MAKFEIFEEVTTAIRHIVEADSMDEAIEKWANGDTDVDPYWQGEYDFSGVMSEINEI